MQDEGPIQTGWRPVLGWVAGAALLYQWILVPLLTWGIQLYDPSLPGPPLIDQPTWQIILGAVGLHLSRSWEKRGRK